MPKGRAKSRINKQFVENEEKKAEALRLVKQGYRLPEIAARLGYKDRRGAHNLVSRALQDLVAGPREEARNVCVARLDHWLTKLADQVEAGDLNAIRVALKVEERRARLLGLDAPVTVHNPNGGPLVQFVVALPPQAQSIAEWQALATPAISVIPQEPPDLETSNGEVA